MSNDFRKLVESIDLIAEGKYAIKLHPSRVVPMIRDHLEQANSLAQRNLHDVNPEAVEEMYYTLQRLIDSLEDFDQEYVEDANLAEKKTSDRYES